MKRLLVVVMVITQLMLAARPGFAEAAVDCGLTPTLEALRQCVDHCQQAGVIDRLACVESKGEVDAATGWLAECRGRFPSLRGSSRAIDPTSASCRLGSLSLDQPVCRDHADWVLPWIEATGLVIWFGRIDVAAPGPASFATAVQLQDGQRLRVVHNHQVVAFVEQVCFAD
jgi:hypothetical protein